MTERKAKSLIFHLLIPPSSLPQQSGLGQAEPRMQELHSSLPRWWLGPGTLAVFFLPLLSLHSNIGFWHNQPLNLLSHNTDPYISPSVVGFGKNI